MFDLPAFAVALGAHRPVEHPALPGRTNHLRAGVLVPIVWDPSPMVLLTLRSPRLRQHAGEVSFPGGRPDPSDADLRATALREAREELGLEDVEVLGPLSSMPVYTSEHRLVPFVGRVLPGPLRPEPGEVAAVLRADLGSLLRAPSVDAIGFDGPDRRVLSPIFEIEGHVVFGATAHTLLELLGVAATAARVPVPPLVEGPWTWTGTRPGRS